MEHPPATPDSVPQAELPPHITVHSFGFKHGGPSQDPQGHGGFLFDCRALPNPFWDEALRPHSGEHPDTVAWLTAQPEVPVFLEHVLALLRFTAQTYRGLERPSLYVSFGCTGGYHRSVFMAGQVAARLRAAGFAVTLQHRDLGNALANKPM